MGKAIEYAGVSHGYTQMAGKRLPGTIYRAMDIVRAQNIEEATQKLQELVKTRYRDTLMLIDVFPSGDDEMFEQLEAAGCGDCDDDGGLYSYDY